MTLEHAPEREVLARFGLDSDDRGAARRARVLWVRVPPLTAVSATAPYLHNGSVPTLRALLEPAPSVPSPSRAATPASSSTRGCPATATSATRCI